MLKLRTILLCNSLYYILLIISFAWIIIWILFFKIPDNELKISKTFVIQNYKIDGDKLTITLKNKNKYLGTYYFESFEEKKNITKEIQEGIKVKINGIITPLKEVTIWNVFSYKKYLMSKKIYQSIKIDTIEIQNKNVSFLYMTKFQLSKQMNKSLKVKKYIQAFVFGVTDDIDSNVINSYQQNGISHLLAISGQQVSLITGLILSLLKKIKVKEGYRYLVASLVVLFYIFITSYNAPVIRASLFFIFNCINKYYYFYIKSINLFYLVIFTMIMINPFLIFDVGFQFSAVISWLLISFESLLNQNNGYFCYLFFTGLISFLGGLPICIFNFYKINFLGLLLNLFFVPLVTFIIFPLTMLTFLMPFLQDVLSFFINIMESISVFVSGLKFGTFIFSKPTIIVLIIYYFFIYLFLLGVKKRNIKYSFYLLILLVSHYFCGGYNKNLEISYLDVGQGDATLIVFPEKKSTILIDTGGKVAYEKENWQKSKKDSSFAKNQLVSHFYSLGIRKIDCLILSHGDYDHVGNAIDLINNIKINKVILNKYSETAEETKIIKILKEKNISYFKVGNEDSINVSKEKIFFLNPILDINENENSIVTYFSFKNYQFLFMADAGIVSEKNLLNKYKLTNIDILKIGHHGSKYSSSEEFIKITNAKYGIISASLDNNFGHPNPNVINNYKKQGVMILETSREGSIKFYINDEIRFETIK